MTFLNELKELLATKSRAEFSRMCGKEGPNMSNYLNGVQKPGTRVLQDCLLNATVSRIFDDPPDENTRLGKKARVLRDRILRSTVSDLFREEIRACQEVESIPDKQGLLPRFGGVYILYDSAGNVLYIGKAKNFRTEVWQTLGRSIPVGMRFGPNMRKVKPTIWDLAVYLSLYQIDNEGLRHNIEALLIRVFINQTHNSNIGKFKVG